VKMLLTIPKAVALIPVAALLAGCATVDPKPDYQRSAKFIEKATGVADVVGERDAAVIKVHNEALLESGLTSGEAVELALLNNPDLQAAFRDIGIARADLVQSGLLSNPTLAMAFRLPAGGGLTAIDLDIAQNIAELWQIPARKRAAERNLEQTILRIAYRASDLAAEAKQAYFAALGAERRLAIARENLEVTRTTLELSEFRKEAGAGSALDVNLARGAVLEAQLAVDRAKLAASDAKRNLASLLGLRCDAERLALVEGPPSVISALPGAELVATALANRLDVRSLREAVRAADERLILEYRRVFPSLTMGLSLEREAREPSQDRDILADTARASIAAGRLTAPEIQPRSARDVDQDVTLGPGFALELPVFDQNQAQIARARFLLEQAVHHLSALETTIVQEVRGVADQAETARRIARFYEAEVLPQSQQNLDLARDSYQAGKTGFLSVLEAERTFLVARERYASALEEAAATLARLEQVVGLPIDDMAPNSEQETEAPVSKQTDGIRTSKGG
jgi:cobalt-zinc-cadmium efflux system outer membrane protein